MLEEEDQDLVLDPAQGSQGLVQVQDQVLGGEVAEVQDLISLEEEGIIILVPGHQVGGPQVEGHPVERHQVEGHQVEGVREEVPEGNQGKAAEEEAEEAGEEAEEAEEAGEAILVIQVIQVLQVAEEEEVEEEAEEVVRINPGPDQDQDQGELLIERLAPENLQGDLLGDANQEKVKGRPKEQPLRL